MPTPATDRAVTVFLYGTLLDPEVLARQAGRRGLHRAARPAVLPGYRRVTLRGTPYPTLIRGRGRVVGLVLRLPPAAWRALMRYEGPLYRPVPVSLRAPARFRRALAWMAAPRRADLALGLEAGRTIRHGTVTRPVIAGICPRRNVVQLRHDLAAPEAADDQVHAKNSGGRG